MFDSICYLNVLCLCVLKLSVESWMKIKHAFSSLVYLFTVCSYLMLLCLLEINGQQDKWTWSKNQNNLDTSNSNRRENRKYERLEDLR